MDLPDTSAVVSELPREVRPAFAPLVKHALGIAVGSVLGAFLLLFAVYWWLRDPADALTVWLLGDNYLPGYRPSPAGAAVGAAWGFVLGFALGWALAAARNLFISVWVALVGARERLKANRDILDQI